MIKKYMFLIIISLLHLTILDAKQINKQGIRFLSPVPDSKYNSTRTNIIIKFNDEINYPERLSSENMIVKGSRSGIHEGRIVIKDQNKTLLFYPITAFENDELITVQLRNQEIFSNNKLSNIGYSFQTSKMNLNHRRTLEKRIFESLMPGSGSKLPISKFRDAKQNGIHNEILLPNDFPEVVLEDNQSAPGVIFFAPFSLGNGRINPTYMVIMDNYGVPIYYKKTTSGILDFKMQNNGLLTYFDMGTNLYYLMNDQLEIIDSVGMKNGYSTDLHELIITDENHYLMMSYDIQKVAMDTIVEGGNPNADVIGLVIQELDENKDVVFQWRSWDHFKITDATHNIDLTADEIDYVHGNAIELDTDGNFMISNRHMDEITKISRETGEIIWRWGGSASENNQFIFVNDSIGFSHQHDIRRLQNGNVILFDNGNLHSPPFSRVVEYSLDETTKIASLVWEYMNDPLTYSIAMGSSRRLENGNTFIGWGWNSGPPSISEVNPDGKVVLSISFPDTLFNYRAFKSSWKSGLVTSDIDSVSFERLMPGDSSVSFINITNNSDQMVELNEFYLSNSAFSIYDSLPISLLPSETREISLIFRPIAEGEFNGRLYLRMRKDDEMIAQVLNLSGVSDSNTTSVNDEPTKLVYALEQNYPNPFNPVTRINYSIAEDSFVKLNIYNILGSEVAVLKNELHKPGSYFVEFDANKLASGIYYYTLDSGKYKSTKKMILLK